MIEWLVSLGPRLHTFGFGAPWWLLLILVIPLPYLWRGKAAPSKGFTFSSAALLRRDGRLPVNRRSLALTILRCLSLGLLAVAIARPQVDAGFQDDRNEGVDIMLVLDYSLSMEVDDFVFQGKQVTRLEAMKQILSEFLENRESDRIGVVGFARDPFFVSPLTTDHAWVTQMIPEVKTMGGTAIGSAIIHSLQVLNQSDAKTKIQIVVTDGLSNTGVAPLDAAQVAAEDGIRIYPIEIINPRGLRPGKAEEHPLHRMATMTKGQFFQATDYESMRAIYEQINNLETSFIQQRRFRTYDELFFLCAIPALAVLLLEFILVHTLWMRIP